jgi:hypothetical protein
MSETDAVLAAAKRRAAALPRYLAGQTAPIRQRGT